MLKADFSLNTLLAAMRDVGCGDPHPVFAGGLRYIPPSAQLRTSRQAFEELSEYGFTQGNGFTPEFEDVLHLIDRPATQLHAYARDTAGQIGILTSKNGRSGVTVVCRDDRVELTSISPDTHPADALVAKLPHCEPAPVRGFSLPQADFRQQHVVSDVFDDDPGRSRQAQELDALLQQTHYGVGQLQNDEKTVNYLDLDTGRVGLALDDGYISVFPGDAQQLSKKLQ